MKGLWIVAYYACAIAGAAIAAVIPIFPFIVLPLVGGLYLPSIVLDIMLVHIIFAVVIRAIDWRWIALPAVAALVWFSYTVPDYWAAKVLQKRLEQSNIPTVPADRRQLIVVDPRNPTQTFLLSQWAEAAPNARVFVNDFAFLPTADGKCPPPFAPASNGIVDACYMTADPPPRGLRVTVLDNNGSSPMPERVHFPEHEAFVKTFGVDRVISVAQVVHLGTIYVGTIEYRSPMPLFEAGCFWGIDGGGLLCAFSPSKGQLFVHETCDLRGFVSYERKVVGILGYPVSGRLPGEIDPPGC